MPSDQGYGIETVRKLIYSNPEIFQRFQPDPEQKYQGDFEDGKRQTARDFYLSCVSAEQIHKVTGPRPQDHLGQIN